MFLPYFDFLAVGGEDDVGLAVGGGDGEDVPGVGGDYAGGDEVDLVGRVGGVLGADGADVGVVAFAEGAFYLDAEEVAEVVDGEVVGGIVSPGLDDAEAEFGGAGHETQLRPLAARLGAVDVHSCNCHGVFVGRPGPLRPRTNASGATCLGQEKTRPWWGRVIILSLLLFYQVGGGKPERNLEIYLA